MPSSGPGAQHQQRICAAPLDFPNASGISFLTVVASVKLRIGHADGQLEERVLAPGSYRVGREDADIVLPHGSVSARHAVLEVSTRGVVIRDLGSRNGTLDPSGRRLASPYALLPEQPVRLGAATLTLLRAPGQAGGTRVMAEMPAPPVERGVLPRAARSAPPGISGWLKLVGAAVVVLLGFASVKTCTALVEAVSREGESMEPARPSGTKAPTKAPASKRPTNERAPRAR